MTLLFFAWTAGALAAGPAARPDGDAPGNGSQRLARRAVLDAHQRFSGDACLCAVDVVAFRAIDPGLPPEDSFAFTFRSPSLDKMRVEERVCLPQSAARRDPRCIGEWETEEAKASDRVRCLPPSAADSGEALLVATRHGLPAPPVDGVRMSLRLVPKRGKGLARLPKLRGKAVWVLGSRGHCQAIDAGTLAVLYKGSCKALRWPD